MRDVFNIFNVIIILGAIQGYLVSLLLIKEYKLKHSKPYLIFLFLGLSSILIKVTLIDILNDSGFPELHLNFIYLIAPSLYLYIKTLSKKAEKKSTNIFHFLPFLIANISYLIFYFISSSITNYFSLIEVIITVDDNFSFLYLATYLYLSYASIKKGESVFTKSQLKWVKSLLLIHLSILIVWLLYIILEWVSVQHDIIISAYYPLMIILSIGLYYKSFYVFNNKLVAFGSSSKRKRENQILEKKQSKLLLKKLDSLMTEQKPFLDTELSLNTLANLLDINSKVLSFIINEHTQKNFNDYINHWRIEEVKKRLKQKEYSHLKMLAIAYDCGFNSKSTFNLAFKKATGMSPSSYKKEE